MVPGLWKKLMVKTFLSYHQLLNLCSQLGIFSCTIHTLVVSAQNASASLDDLYPLLQFRS